MKRKPKTEEEVAAEIKLLKDLKPRIRRFSAFGDDHWKSIDLQIRVLEEGMEEDDIESIEDSDLNSMAYETLQWRDGEDVDESPAKGWESLVRS